LRSAAAFRGGFLPAGIGLLLLFPLSSPDAFFLDVFTTGFLLAAFAASWDVVGGVSGQITLGHALPFGAAAYACALLTSVAGWPLLPAVAAAVLLAAAVGAGIGTLSAPLAGPFVALLTLALGEIAHEVAVGHTFFSGPGGYAWGGEGGIPVALPWRDAPPFSSYYAALVFLCLAAFGMLRFTRSGAGLILRAVAGSPITAQASGVPIARFKRLAFAVGSAFAGAAGAGFALHVGRATANDLSLELSFQAATFAAVGGRGTIVGPVVAALVLHVLFQGLSLPPSARVLLYALALLVTLRFFPREGTP
jgi:branched-chain amino acid transport system permease protein